MNIGRIAFVTLGILVVLLNVSAIALHMLAAWILWTH